MGYELLNYGSLLLGLAAWICPMISLSRHDKGGHKNWAGLSLLSMGACTAALYFQILYGDHKIEVQDWSTLLDTSGAVVGVSTVLLVVTFALNAAAWAAYRKNSGA